METMKTPQKVIVKQYEVIKAACEEAYAKAMAALEQGHIEHAQKHMEVFERYNRVLQEIESELETP